MRANRFRYHQNSAALLALLAAAPIFASPAAAQVLADAAPPETIVVTGTQFNPDNAPAKSSLDTMEPKTIINKSYIDDFVANTADYTTILAIAPSMTGQDINGPGLSDGNVKNTLRGLPDGNFVLSYDGIPFGDTNGPTHHSESYFPGPTIGSIDIDRGPGNAGNLGAATYGGSVNMFSEVLRQESQTRISATGGSWGTFSVNGNYQSGDLDLGGVNSSLLINLNDTGSSGYLTFQNTSRQNALVKAQMDLGAGWVLTAFANYNGLFQHVNDNNGATPAQITSFGEDFGLQITNTKAGTYQPYNPEAKKTDMDYLRLQGAFSGITVDDTFYTYAYVNKTISSTNVMQTQTDITNGVTEGNGTVVNGVKFASDVPGYTKQNAYRVWGNILRLSDDFDFGWLTGQLRGGVWWEGSATQRARYDFDLTQCIANNCNPFHDRTTYADSSLSASSLGASKAKSAAFDGGFAEYSEHSGWTQYEPFVELELRPIEDLTVTPGFKYVTETLSVSAPLEQKTVPVLPFAGSFTSTRALPFLMANYKIEPNWSVYAQYANGIYVPDISSFEQTTPVVQFPKPETTTNYQLGTVFYADNFTFDADIYYIGVNNNIAFAPCTSNPGETCAIDTGKAVYKGIEGEGTYAFDNGLSLFASGSLNNTKTSGTGVAFPGVLKNAPLWTAAAGLIYKIDIYKLSLTDKVVGQQYVGKQTLSTALSSFYKLPAYNTMDFKGSITLGPTELSLSVNNVLDQRNLLAVTVNDKALVGSSITDLAHRGTSLDQYYYAPSRSFQLSLTARF